MLTKWGAALGLASAGRVVAGGGGVIGDATVWGPVLDWTALGTIAGPLRVGDLAAVTDLGPVGSSGVAQYNGADWELQQAVFATVADLTAFGGGGELIGSGAIAIVGTGIETDPAYYYDTATLQWLRMPDGVHYIWQQRADWTALGTIPAPQNNDRVAVQTLGTAHSSGVAERHGGSWKLVQGRFASVADMVAFPESVHPGAFAEVKAGGGHDDDSVTYVYQSGAWVRYAALTAGFAWDITDLTNTDPSGIGATQIGDFARYTNPTTSAVQVYRLRAVTIDSAIGGGTLTTWVPASIYGEAGLTIRGYLIGTETMPAPGGNIQGYLVTASGASASVTTSGGEVVITSTTAAHFAAVQSTYALQPSDRYYVRMNIRLSQTALTNTTFYHLLYDNGTTQPQFITTQNPNVSGGVYIPSTTVPALVGSTLMIRGSGTAIANTAEVLEVLADGTAANLVSVTRNARPYFSMRRNAQTGTATGQHLIQTFQNATGAQTARFSFLYFMTY